MRLKSGVEMIYNNTQVWVHHDREDGNVAIRYVPSKLQAKKVDVVDYFSLAPAKKIKQPIVVKNTEPIKRLSKAQMKRLAQYRVVRDEYLAEHPVCEYPGCNCTDVTLHHKDGRIGAYLTNKKFFCSLCPKHHRFAEENPVIAKTMGLSEDRL